MRVNEIYFGTDDSYWVSLSIFPYRLALPYGVGSIIICWARLAIDCYSCMR
jgi:hypothetical protein